MEHPVRAGYPFLVDQSTMLRLRVAVRSTIKRLKRPDYSATPMTRSLAAILLLSATTHAESRLVVRTVLAGKRVTRTENIEGAAKMITLSAARNEFEPFQIVVRA